MSAALLQATVEHIRASFTGQELVTVAEYGGEFSAAEIDRVSFACPAVLVTVLGWQPPGSTSRLRGKHARAVRMAAFVVTKHATRKGRLAEAMTLAGKLTTTLRNWVPGADLPLNVAALNEAPTADNLYGSQVDKQGLALWLVDWTQDAEPKPGDGLELFDLVRVDIEDTTHQGRLPAAPTPAPTPAPLVVTEDVKFKTPL